MNKELTPLEALERIINAYKCGLPINTKDIRTIETTLKALEIVEKKQVQVDWFIHCSKNFGVEELNYYNNGYVSSVLTQEEFNLLKEVLK